MELAIVILLMLASLLAGLALGFVCGSAMPD